MSDVYPVMWVEATAEDVLAMLRDQHRQASGVDPEVDREAVISFEMTIAEWRRACDLLAWRRVGNAINKYWGVEISMNRWEAVMEPAKGRRLRGVCELLAREVKLSRVRPSRMLGSECMTAGVFLTVRSMLREAGADVRELVPSTELGVYTRKYGALFMGKVSQLAPGALPPVRLRSPVYHGFTLGFMVFLLAACVSGCAGLLMVTVVAALMAGGCYAGIWVAAKWVGPAEVRFGELRTFRDLATVIARADGC